ncbi:NUDIX domain-containing protein [Streptomyces aidingensis]|uniref:ADP-ribose pyrophosphatase YjhB, NUDIX family n=1 Tax=Streptomyces aidingensis TaxID=910347 RepID=A0A1I1SG27_9ACTN|nr:NUDIX domain-containing protein [Streptomyces aidingensis]SFD45429.1 ADP-ribose pyrophosphatase YjhB, NUDIX family [Streptomyces aidingensis]
MPAADATPAVSAVSAVPAAPAARGSARDAHCGWCGGAFPPEAGWPRTCAHCGRTSYRNPLPVAVALVPVRSADSAGPGLIVIRRTAGVRRGGLALPGGFVDHGEDWRGAVVRELAEETGIPARAEEVRLADVLSSDDGHLLVFGLLPERDAAALPPSRPTGETAGWQLLPAPGGPLTFPLHTRAAANWFAGHYT